MVHFLWKVGSAADFEELNEIRVHLFVVVGNTQHSDALAGAGVLELAVEPVAVGSFYHDNDILPFELLGGEGDDGVIIEPG